ncbi:hypothetical protein PXD56_09270 [Maribacter sp. SA7]|uniref:hypothetical protein n=1 Tax=Maribacter zhoushanensis TaxID=3030012 RepID=UPI0023EE2142|nr:hypothetical protein [Maribacter zhoushanensis]MDF4203145.1 hypothetical protein [Maribacter zhoushanensis]
MIKNKKPTKVYSQEVIDTQHVFTKDDTVYLKNSASYESKDDWSPIQFKWVSVDKFQDNLELE